MQDGLLSFQIKETVFLSSDKTGIGELRELELQPDVEIIESQQEISITGCLHLYGKYEPYRPEREEDAADGDTLVAAMRFTPFQLEENKSGTFPYTTEESIAHRIPVNISIPLARVEEIGDIYAIVDSFDYQLDHPSQLQIQAVLKIAGITMRTQGDAAEEHAEEKWEFVHVTDEAQEHVPHPDSLEEIERKLAELEEEIRLQEQPGREGVAAVFAADDKGETGFYHFPTAADEEQVSHGQPFSSYDQESAQPVASYRDESAQPLYGDLSESSRLDAEWQTGTPQEQPDAILPVEAAAGHPENQPQAAGGLDEAAEALAETAETVETVETAETVEEPVLAETHDDAKEMKVAIGSKAAPEPEAKVNITTIFTQAKRMPEPPAIVDADDSSPAGGRWSAEGEERRKRLESLSNLTSVVRQSEEKMSRLRICIIQRNETIESIAARYNLSTSRLLEINNLTSDRVSEGQILYIPQ
nr:LysM peptidoglycan-binding domain-containing protein [Brevibacillus sp. SYP-B805]